MLDTAATGLRDRYLAAQLAGNRREAIRLLVDEGILRGLSVSELHMSVIQPAQYEIGRLWQENRITVAQEHMATAISQLALSHLYRYLPRDEPNGKVVMVACVEGELHELGPRMASDFLEMAGFDVRYLGASVPSEHLARTVAEEKPDLLALSVTMSYHLSALREAVVAVRKAAPQVPVVVGGTAFLWIPNMAEELGVPFCGRDARELVAAACRILEV